MSRAGAPHLAAPSSSAQNEITTIGGQGLRTEKQAGYAWSLAKKAGMDEQAYEAKVIELTGTLPSVMTLAQANKVIDTLKGMAS